MFLSTIRSMGSLGFLRTNALHVLTARCDRFNVPRVGGCSTLALACALALPGSLADAGPYVETATIIPPQLQADDFLGSSIFVSSNTVAIGAPGVDGSRFGKIFLYAATNPSNPVFQSVLYNPGGHAGDSFGGSAYIYPNGEIWVGAGTDNFYGASAGSMSAWKRENPFRPLFYYKWAPEDVVPGDRFGTAISYNLFGSPGADSRGEESGSVYRVSAVSTGPPSIRSKATPRDAKPYDRFGSTIVSAEGWAYISAPGSPDRGQSNGAVFIYDVSGFSLLEEVAKIAPLGLAVKAGFGTSLAYSEARLAIGAPFDTDSRGLMTGAVYVYDVTDRREPELLTRVLPIEASLGDEFGRSVAFSSSTLVVGAPSETYNGVPGAGSAWVYDVFSFAEPALSGRLRAAAPTEGGSFGSAVGILENQTVLAGAAGTDAQGTDSGAAHLFQSGFLLTVVGDCPGSIEVCVSTGIGDAPVHFFTGTAVLPGSGPTVPSCPGFTVDLKNPRLAGRAKPVDGRACLVGDAPPSVCGRISIQAVQVDPACRVSNIVLID